MAMILVTHDLGVIAGSTDRLAVMYAGQVIKSGLVLQKKIGAVNAVSDVSFTISRGQTVDLVGESGFQDSFASLDPRMRVRSILREPLEIQQLRPQDSGDPDQPAPCLNEFVSSCR